MAAKGFEKHITAKLVTTSQKRFTEGGGYSFLQPKKTPKGRMAACQKHFVEGVVTDFDNLSLKAGGDRVRAKSRKGRWQAKT